MSKKSKVPDLNEPFRHQDHPRPRTRREFVAQGFMTGPPRSSPRHWRACSPIRAPHGPHSLRISKTAVTNCNITTGAGMIPFICFDLAVAATSRAPTYWLASHRTVGFPDRGGLQQAGSAGLHGAEFQRRREFRGRKLRAALSLGQRAFARHEIARQRQGHGRNERHGDSSMSNNDTNTNPHNPMYGIYQAGARGGLLDLIGSDSSQSGGNSMAPPTMVIASAMPTKISSSQDSKGLVSTGQLSTLLPNAADVTNVLESMKRISDAKYAQVTAYTDPTLNTAALGRRESRRADTPSRRTSSTSTTALRR